MLLNFLLRLRVLWAAIRGLPYLKPGHDITPVGRLYASVVRNGAREDLGLICTKVVTDAGVAAIVDAFQGTFTINNFRFHASGTGTAAEAVGQTTLGTEVASRVSGTQGEAAANIYRTVATIPYSGTFAITEHGVFSASSSGTLLDRSLFAAINVQNGDSIEFTYDLTVPAGS
jgi:hypothetical protein